MAPSQDPKAGFDVGNIDEVIHGRIRLGIMAYLSSVEAADFAEIKAKLQTTDGNLSVHLRKLEDAGFVQVEKTFAGRKPLTRAQLTPKGREAFIAYLDQISALVALR
ncbi:MULTISPECIES: winged helix-turn-helix domain-containing protein [unclassified Brevundimonas]|uniref:winged helix-turn-helix domain-containing protein n=1 Tax=unclassified Brevundimonas TaxID=2622653 RepID=UPI0025BAA5DD|nr:MULTISPECIES: transcriptional regulator [unclassified Brevundimonas]